MSKKYFPFIWILLTFVLIYTRFLNLGWGLPYPMHPDERNMVDAIMRLSCENPRELLDGVINNVPIFLRTFVLGEPSYAYQQSYQKVQCANPNFFAYGQFVLYIGYLIAWLVNGVSGAVSGMLGSDAGQVRALSFSTVALALRILSATTAVLSVFVVLSINRLVRAKTKNAFYFDVLLLLLLSFSPVLIQFAHFGTTESMLIFLYLVVVYFSLSAQICKDDRQFLKYMALAALFCGVAIASKVSSTVFCVVPMFVLSVRYSSVAFAKFVEICKMLGKSLRSREIHLSGLALIRDNIITIWLSFVRIVITSILFVLSSLAISFVFSPHNVVSFPEFFGSFSYERDIGTGRYVAFYTRQFLYELPLLFHIENIFPFSLGVLASLSALLGLFFAPWKKRENLLRFAIFFYCILTMPWYAKWTRFIAPIYPLILLFSFYGLIFVEKYLKFLKVKKGLIRLALVILVVAHFLPGIAYLAVYKTEDVRFVASRWVFENVEKNARVLSETANVIDIPIVDPKRGDTVPAGYNIAYVSFNFYNIDENPNLYSQYKRELASADYIFVPSRRIFYNHTCIDENSGKTITTRHSKNKCLILARDYPKLKKHYEDLFSGKLGFVKVAQFQSFPRISIFGKTIFEFADEEAEETFTVFDHPVIRIYKRVTLSPDPIAK